MKGGSTVYWAETHTSLHIILGESVHKYFYLVLQHLHIVFRDEAPLSLQLPLQPARLSWLSHCRRGHSVNEGRYNREGESRRQTGVTKHVHVLTFKEVTALMRLNSNKVLNLCFWFLFFFLLEIHRSWISVTKELCNNNRYVRQEVSYWKNVITNYSYRSLVWHLDAFVL